MSVRSIAVAADDFGLDPQINEAALMLASLGRVSAIGCMVGAPSWQEGAKQLRALDPRRVDVGLHLDLTQHPLDSAVRRPLGQWILRTHLGGPVQGLRAEIESQLDAFAQALQAPPAFVDGHEHVHQFPHVRTALVEALAARNWRPWLRSTRRPAGVRSTKARVIEALGAAALEQLARGHGLRHNGALAGVYGFGDGPYLPRLRGWLPLLRQGDLLMCHPAAQRPRAAPLPAARCREYADLASAAFADLLAELDLAIAPLSTIDPRTPGTTAARPGDNAASA